MNERLPRRRILLAAVVVGFTLAAIPYANGAGGGGGGATNKTFTSSLHFGDPIAGKSEADVAITNTSKGPQSFASANIVVPSTSPPCAGCTPPHTSYDDKGFSAGLVTNTDGTWTLQIRSVVSSGVAPGATLHAYVWVTRPAVCSTTAWPVAVKQSNDFSGTGNDFVGTAAAPAPYLSFTTQPPAATAYNADMIGPPPQVSSFDGCGGAVTTAPAITVTDTAGHLSAYSTTSTGNVTTISGTRFGSSFDFTDQLVASAVGYSAAKSTAFLVAEKVQPCSSASCPPLSLDSVTKTSAVLSVTNPPSQSTLESGSETGPDNSLCGAAAAGIPDSEISATISVDAANAKTVTITLAKSLVLAIANNGAPFMSVCLRTTDSSGTTTDTTLPDCFKGGITAAPPCVDSRTKNQANEVIVVQLPAGDPHLGVY